MDISFNQVGWSTLQKFLNNALAPSGALALFEIFAGRISCNKRPHNRYLLLHLTVLVTDGYKYKDLEQV